MKIQFININLLSFAVPVLPLAGMLILPYLSLSGKKDTNVRFLHSKPTIF